jgi:hypothetical protein
MKINFVSRPSYAEEGQPNPLRWCILSGTPETGFVNETSWLRCKDFFNDYVVAYNGGKRFGIYGFSTEKMVLAPQGTPVYIAVDATTKAFSFNMATFNTWLQDNELPPVPYTPYEGKWVLEFDPFYFSNTYNVSLVSLIIRLCNVEEEFETFEDLIHHKGFAPKDQQKWDKVVEAGRFFNLPEEMKKYVWYASKDANSENYKDGYSLASLVHHGGVLSWTNAMKGMV